jgi:fatty-acyl-CoA synthase
MFIPDPARRRAELAPDALAFTEVATGRTISFGAFDDLAERMATVLSARLTPGDRVAVLCHNTLAFFALLMAVGKAELILVPLNWRQPVAELAPIVADCAAKLILSDAANGPAARVLAAGAGVESCTFDALEAEASGARARRGTSVWADDRVWYLLYTSGTTGKPKAVIQTPGMMMANAINVWEATGLDASDQMANFLPLFHTAGINLHTLPLFLMGGVSHILPKFDLDGLTDLMAAGKVSVFFGVPAIYQQLSLSLRFANLDLSSVRHWGCGGAPLSEALIRQFLKRGITVCNGMGMTETGPTAFFMDRDGAAKKIGSVGKPRLMTEVRLVGADGLDVPAGEQGEILFRGPGITPGYYGNPAATQATFTSDGWLRSGDVGRRDADGYYYIVDRIKDMYISGGENVYPAEVEAALDGHPAVLEAIVVGVPDERWGETGHAFVRLRPDATLDEPELRAYLRQRLAGYKVPRDITLVDDFPRTAAGKVQKHVLKAGLAAPEASR